MVRRRQHSITIAVDKGGWHVHFKIMKHDYGLRLAIAAAGSERKLGAGIGVSGQAVNQWPRVPAEMVVKVEKATGVQRETLRPDLYRVNESA
jgi:hypothetical protein